MDQPGNADPHREYRICHAGGAVYLIIEGVLWLLSAALRFSFAFLNLFLVRRERDARPTLAPGRAAC